MKKTKIICTLGPTCETKETLSALYDAGMNVCRLNFSHGTHADQTRRIRLIRALREERHAPLPIVLDTRGPEFRIGTFKEGKVTLQRGDSFIFTSDPVEGDAGIVSVSYPNLARSVCPGNRILLNNGLISFLVEKIEGNRIFTTVQEGGTLSDRKSMFFPDKTPVLPFLSEEDKKDLLFGIREGVDYVALSFVSNRENTDTVRNFLRENGGERIGIISKIENRSGVEHLREIIDASDGIMVARGDLGVEIPYEGLPAIQKRAIEICRAEGKICITATEMLESMIRQPRPTRAEISDVANAVYDGSDAVMLSGETAAGSYPEQAVLAMAKIVQQAEENVSLFRSLPENESEASSLRLALSRSACRIAEELHAGAIVVCTRTGATARAVSRFRSRVPVIGMTSDEATYRRLALSWGVVPMMSEEFGSVDVLFYFAARAALRSGLCKKGDTVVITGGAVAEKSNASELINIVTL